MNLPRITILDAELTKLCYKMVDYCANNYITSNIFVSDGQFQRFKFRIWIRL